MEEMAAPIAVPERISDVEVVATAAELAGNEAEPGALNSTRTARTTTVPEIVPTRTE